MNDTMQLLKDIIRQNDVDYLMLDSWIARKMPNLKKDIVGLLDGDIKVGLVSSYFDGASGDCCKTY